MNPMGAGALAAAIAYLIGSTPFGFLAARLVAGVDIRTQGSGNIGATNVGRVMGFRWFASVLVLDMVKGLLPVLLLPRLLLEADSSAFVHAQVACGIAAILGHMFPCWLRFRGGKGVATALGVIAVLSWQATLAAATVFAVVFALTRIVSLGSMLAAIAFTVAQFVLLWPTPFGANFWSLALFSLAVPVLIIVRHRANLGRLLRGEEKKYQPGVLAKKPPEASE